MDDEERLIDKNWMTVKAVARRMNVSDKHVYSLMAERKLPYIKFGNAYRIPLDELEAYLEKRRSRAI